MSTKMEDDNSVWRWYITFDDLNLYQIVVAGLQEMSELQDGELVKCPDGKSRMTIEVRRELIKQFKTISFGGQKVDFIVMVKRVCDGDFEFIPNANVLAVTKPRMSKKVSAIILGSSLLRRQQRHAAKAEAH